jgi:hypothetical protein
LGSSRSSLGELDSSARSECKDTGHSHHIVDERPSEVEQIDGGKEVMAGTADLEQGSSDESF